MDLGGAGLRPAPGNDGAGGGDTALAGVPWMAPERVRGGEQADDHRSDLYALGCLLYQLLTGTTPFGHREVTLQFGAHLRETPAPPSRHRPGLPAGLDALVLGLLAKDPEDRPQSAAEVAAQLGGLAVETAAVAGPGAPGFPAEAAVVAVAPAAPVAVVAIEPVAVWSAADFHGAHPDDRRPGRRRAALVAGTTALAVALVAGAVWAAAGRPAGTVGPARPAAAAADAPAGAEDPGTDPADSGLTAGSASAAPGGSGAPTGSGSAGPSGSAAATGASTAPPATAGPGPAAGATTAPGSTAPAGAPGTTPARPPASPGTAAAAYGCTGGLVGSYPVATGAGVVLGYYYVFFDNAKGTNCAATIKTSDSGYGTASAVSATISRCTQTAPAASCTKVAGTTATDSGSYKMYAGPVKVAAVATCITGYGSITWGGVTATTAKSLGNRAVHCA
jgi:serine/threonine-protein kinase